LRGFQHASVSFLFLTLTSGQMSTMTVFGGQLSDGRCSGQGGGQCESCRKTARGSREFSVERLIAGWGS